MNWIKKYILILSTIPVLIVYLMTQAPGVIHIDSGELAAVAALPGIAHPTGYPLFTILGYLYTLNPIFESKIKALNFLSSIYTLIGYYFIAKTNFLILKHFRSNEQSHKKTKKKETSTKTTDEFSLKVLSIMAAYVVAFSKTFWTQSTSVEVYSLHIALISIAIYLFLKAYLFDAPEFKSEKSTTTNKHWILFSFFFGLALTNHMTSILLIPGFAFLFFSKYGLNKATLKKILILLIPLVVALAFYAYLPLKALANPEINWGNPIDFERFKRHIMGWQYQSWIFSSTESASKQFKYFLNIFPVEFAFVGIAFFLIGIYTAFKVNRKIFTFLLLLFITCVLYSINYDINDIDSYFLLAFIATGFFILFAFRFLFEKFKYNLKNSSVIFILIPFILVVYNYERVDQSRNTQFQNYTYAVLQSAEENAVIISYLWDFFISPSYYIQFIEKYRRDVTVIDKELLRRSWYFNQLKRINPLIYARSENLINEFIPELLKFERNQNYNSMILEKYYREIITDLITKNINDRPVYLTPEIVTQDLNKRLFMIPDTLMIVPDLFMFKVVKDTSYHNLEMTDYTIQFLDRNDYYTSMLKNLITTMHINRAIYELKFNYRDKARKFVELALKVNPQLQLPQELFELIQ